jgi:cytochrome b subunit of formate dehydrogenase
MKRRFGAGRIVFFILVAAIAVLVFGGVVMLLWNNVLAQVTNVSTITFLQALGILVLAKILFGGFRGGWGPRRYYWRQRMMQKWTQMTPEEREKFKNEWRSRCGGWGYGNWSETASAQGTSESPIQSSESASKI